MNPRRNTRDDLTDTEKVLLALGADPRKMSGGNIAIGIWVGKIKKSLRKQGRLPPLQQEEPLPEAIRGCGPPSTSPLR